MSVDFDTIVAKPQSKTVIPVKPDAEKPKVAPTQTSTNAQPNPSPAPVMQQPLAADTFKSNLSPEEAKKKKTLESALKYSGVAALIATPIALVINHNLSSKAIKNAMNSSIQELGNKFDASIAKLGKEVTTGKGSSEETQKVVTAIGEKTEDIKKMVNKLLLAIGALAGVEGASKLFGKEDKKDEFGLKPETIKLLENEATMRIDGTYAWPKIDHINSWMVTAETETFMKVGGLAEVGVQLPDEFNKRHDGDPSNTMTILTPLYEGKGNGGNGVLVDNKNGTYKYNDKIDLTKIDTMPIKVYNNHLKKYEIENVDIFTGTITDPDKGCDKTKYIFFRNPRLFNIVPHENNHPEAKGGYVLAKNGVGEVERMTFFAKSVFEFMKKAKEQPIEGITPPNVILANDWHAAPISSLMRYYAPVVNELDKGKMPDETLEYMKDIPIIHVTHNTMYQGREEVHEKADTLFRTLFGEYKETITDNIKGYEQKGFPLADTEYGYNTALADMYLADRIIPVSTNYAKELCKSNDLACGLQNINTIRADHETLLGIINGYTKSKAEPNERMMNTDPDNGINVQLRPSSPFIPFDHMYNEEGYNIKMQNKASALKLLNELAARGVNKEHLLLKPDNTTYLYNPENCEVPENVDVRTIPFISNYGRFTTQKGFDYLIESTKRVLTTVSKNGKEPPIVAILGSGAKDDPTTDALKKFKDDLMKTNPEAGKRLFIFIGFSGAIRDAIATASDFTLVPSKWEPCGLTQMEAMPKGSLPIATATGGLVDTIEDGVDGFLTNGFFGYASEKKENEKEREVILEPKTSANPSPRNNIEAYTSAMYRALDTFYTNPEKIKQMAITAMTKDFSWTVPDGALDQYEELMKTGKVTKRAKTAA